MKIILPAAMATVLALPAFAAGPGPVIETAPATPVYTQPVTYGSDWTGGYVGGQIGYADLGGDEVEGTSLDGSSGLLGLHAGYMYDFGSYVLGAEIDWDTADFDIPLSDSLDSEGVGDIDSIARLKFRAGADLGRTMPYAVAGLAYVNADGPSDLVDFDESGWVAGIGVAHQLTDRWIVGGELLHHRFDDFATEVDNGGTSYDLEATTVSLRASFRF